MSAIPCEAQKPVSATVIAIIGAVLIQPLIGIDVIYDIIAVAVVASKWVNYYKATRGGGSIDPTQVSSDIASRYVSLGVYCYDAGDYVNALSHFKKAADRGSKDAARRINDIGIRYYTGDVIAKDFVEAVRIFKIAAEFGGYASQYNLGMAYRYGNGVSTDLATARHWYGLAAAQGDEDAKKALAEMDEEARQREAGSRPSGNGRMSRAEALEILDLKEGATVAAIKAAYARLIQQVHPDKGGSTFFAKQLNEARSVLLA